MRSPVPYASMRALVLHPTLDDTLTPGQLAPKAEALQTATRQAGVDANRRRLAYLRIEKTNENDNDEDDDEGVDGD